MRNLKLGRVPNTAPVQIDVRQDRLIVRQALRPYRDYPEVREEIERLNSLLDSDQSTDLYQ